MDRELKQQFELINKKLNLLAAQARKETWVPYNWVVKVTGWDKEELRQARERNIVEYKQGDKGILYLLESIPEIFIKQKQAV